MRSVGRKEEDGEDELGGGALVLLFGEMVSLGSSDSSSRREVAWAEGLKEPPPPKGPELPGNLESAIIRAGGSGCAIGVVYREVCARRLILLVMDDVGRWQVLMLEVHCQEEGGRDAAAGAESRGMPDKAYEGSSVGTERRRSVFVGRRQVN